MSFGISLSDVITLSELAKGTYDGWRNAPDKYRSIVGDLYMLQTTLDKLNTVARAPNSPLREDHSGMRQWKKLSSGCKSLLAELDEIQKKYSTLKTDDHKQTWKRIKFGSSNLDSLRQQLVIKTAGLNAYLSALELNSLGRIEHEIFPQMLSRLDHLAARRRKWNESSSSLTTYNDDDKVVWKKFRRDLYSAGFRSADIEKFAPKLKTFLGQLQSTEPLDGVPREDSSSPTSKRSSIVDSEAPQKGPSTDIWIQLVNENQDMEKTRSNGKKGKESKTRQYSLPNNFPVKHTPGHDSQQKHHSTTEHMQNSMGNMRFSNGQPPIISKQTISAGNEDCYNLYSASGQGRVETIRALLANGADINISRNDGATPLHEAAFNGHFKTVELLLTKGANITATDEEGWTALHYASYGGHAKVVRLLLANGAEFAVTEEEGWTPLHCASHQGHVKVAILLIEKGAKVTATDKSMLTPLLRATYREHFKLAGLLRKEVAKL
ncbi:uncharacterized protein A1O9_09608 [Exophiala aquamarina CBS 119918]|uniref:Uncharacterized protein n=1 Tax=Exophiala aquamarina CBS 119918 TaxID=1182545 RepID=A0A072P3L1_9EURO|nr:uncharacterized protein A1O9_09608 [Exophiala aquamarina CBS 119918]KEF54441.1 hypothetical protein A1O9_09608 [Exophiala aquamarina CBS 119918]